MPIESISDARGYFQERLSTALSELGVVAEPHTEHYLVELLAAGQKGAVATPDQPLVHRLQAAIEARDRRERLRSYREAGDAALYTSGFFAEHLQKRGLSHDYYVELGARAYCAASELCGQRADVYHQLGARFDDYSKVLEEVRESTVLRTPQDIVRLYDRWRRTRSPRLAARLHAAGVFPQIPKDDVH